MNAKIEKYKPETLSPAVVNKAIKVNKIQQVFDLTLPSFRAIEKVKGTEFVAKVIGQWIIALNMYIYGNDTEKALTQFQIETVSNILAERAEVKNLNIADVALIFKKAFSGEFGKLYGRLRPDVIVQWFTDYFDERCETAANKSLREHEWETANLRSLAENIHPDIAEKLHEAAKEMSVKFKQENQKGLDKDYIQIESGNKVDFETWEKWFETNKKNLGITELKRIKSYLSGGNTFGFYDKKLTWIENRITELRVKNSVNQ